MERLRQSFVFVLTQVANSNTNIKKNVIYNFFSGKVQTSNKPFEVVANRSTQYDVLKNFSENHAKHNEFGVPHTVCVSLWHSHSRKLTPIERQFSIFPVNHQCDVSQTMYKKRKQNNEPYIKVEAHTHKKREREKENKKNTEERVRKIKRMKWETNREEVISCCMR